MELLTKNWKIVLLAFASALGYLWFGYFLDRTNFFEIAICFSICFAAYFYFLQLKKPDYFKLFLILGILFRLLFLFSTPTLSDDYFRFIWDGQLSLQGLNPFDELPTDVTTNFQNKEELLQGMNSSEYYTVYPPIAQFIYFCSAWLSPNSIFGSVLVLRILILLSEIAILFLLPVLLKQLNSKPVSSLLYILNPLVIVELSGNLHFESFMILFLLLAILLISRNKTQLSALAWSFAAAVKLLPLLLLPILFRKLSLKSALLHLLLVGVIFAMLWLPFFNSKMIPHFLESVNLYHSTFEFNASIYYLIRWIGFKWLGYNVIGIAGSWLSKLAIVLMILVLLRKSNREWKGFFNSLLWAMAIYYCMALIVHPWYICTLVFLSVFSLYRFAIAWSALATLSYFAYSNPDFQENFWLIAIEYSVVFFILVRELVSNQFSKNTLP